MTHIPVKDTLRIALVGDYNHDVVAHQAIPLAIDDAAAVLEITTGWRPPRLKVATTSLAMMQSGSFRQVRIKIPKGPLLPFSMRGKTRYRFLAPAAVSSMPLLNMPAT